MTHIHQITPSKVQIRSPLAGTVGQAASCAIAIIGRLVLGTGRLIATVPGAIGRAAAMAYVDPFTPSTRPGGRHDHYRR
jgi:hypothetical protein